jgi:hypothetical protein
MSTIAQLLQAGQPDLELAAVTPRLLLAPITSTPLTTIEDTTNGGLDLTKVGYGTSPYVTVGNFEKKAGLKIGNKPQANRIMSAGQGSPSRIIFSEAGRSITYVPQETNLTNLQNSWGFTLAALSAPSAKGGITIGVPSLPARTVWRGVAIAGDTYAPTGNPIYLFWIFSRLEVSDRQDVQAVDSDVLTSGVTLEIQDDPAVSTPVIFGICGQGWVDATANTNSGLVSKAHTVTLGTQSSGTFTLTWGGNTTSAIAYNATSATVKSALVALDDGYGTGNWNVTGSAGGPYSVTTPTPLPLTGDGSALTTPANFSVT